MHKSYGKFTPEQIKQAMELPFGKTHPYLQMLNAGFCDYCKEFKKDVVTHMETSKRCLQKKAQIEAAVEISKAKAAARGENE